MNMVNFSHIVKSRLRFIVVLLLITVLNPVYSQVKLGIGLRTHVGGMQAFKDVKGHYDDMRPWLNNQMGSSARMVGLEFGGESSTEKYGVAFAHVYLVGSSATASGTNGGQDYKRKIKARMWGIETVDAWYTPVKIGKFNFGAGVMPFGLGVFRVSTKVNDEARVKIPLSDLQSKLDYSFTKTNHMYAQFHIDLTRVYKQNESAFHLQFFYSLGPKREYELFFLNQEINPGTYSSLYKRTMMKVNNFGFKLMLSF